MAKKGPKNLPAKGKGAKARGLPTIKRPAKSRMVGKINTNPRADGVNKI
jgi:hypothetical protein